MSPETEQTAPVQHASLVTRQDPSGQQYKCCSNCGRAVRDPYCPHCGAMLDLPPTTEVNNDDEGAVLYVTVKDRDDGGESVDVSTDVQGSEDSVLAGLVALISDVAELMGRDFVSLCYALAANPPPWLARKVNRPS